MKELYESGYESDQINQILKIEETGFLIRKLINVNVSSKKLRELRTLLKETYNYKQKKAITNYYIYKDEDITNYIEKGLYISAEIEFIKKASAKGYDESYFLGKNLNLRQMQLIYKYLKKEIDITKYVLEGREEEEIETILLLEKNKISYEYYSEFKTLQKRRICAALTKGINPIKYITPTTSIAKLNAIIKALTYGVDLNIVIKNDISGEVMDVIVDGLKNGYDITPYIDKTINSTYATIILRALKKGIDISKIKIYRSTNLVKMAISLIKEELPTEILDDEKYDETQLDVIVNAMIAQKKQPDIDINKLYNPEFSADQMEKILKVMCADKKADDLLICGVKPNVLDIIEQNVLKDITFDGLITKDITCAEVKAIAALKSLGYKISK